MPDDRLTTACWTVFLALVHLTSPHLTEAQVDLLQGEMTGEVSTNGAILQSRLTAPKIAANGDVPGAAGVARFEISAAADFRDAVSTEWISAEAEQDFVVKALVSGLKPATKYYYRVEFGKDRGETRRGPSRSFRTHHAPDVEARHSFVVVTGMNYHYFHHGGPAHRVAYTGPDKRIGYPALATILSLKPDFFVGTGDNIYYDSPRNTSATTAAAMRKKWHEQFVQPRYVELFGQVPTYWEKDDHDFRYDDSDTTGEKEPSTELGLRIFREQVPVTDPMDPDAVTFRTYRAGKLLQIWLPENRDYRSPNLSPDGPEKTLWGKAQREWLQRTLLASDATFKIIVSPTPMIGPDDITKKDNHTDVGGFQHEGESFFGWAKENGFLDKGLYFVCGDRHWQYHSINPAGFEEFSCGALVDANSRLGVRPGSKRSTDPEARIKQPYTSPQPSGGFLNVVVEPVRSQGTATARFNFHDEKGALLYSSVKERSVE